MGHAVNDTSQAMLWMFQMLLMKRRDRPDNRRRRREAPVRPPPPPLTTVQSRDMKPDVNELNRQMQQNGKMEGVEAGSGTAGDGAGDLAARVKVKEEEDTRLGHLRHKYKLLTQRFNSLQRNVHKLLSFIVPDVDLGSEDDIEHIVTEMIRVNCNQESSWLLDFVVVAWFVCVCGCCWIFVVVAWFVCMCVLKSTTPVPKNSHLIIVCVCPYVCVSLHASGIS